MLGFYMDDSADAGRKKVFSVAGFLADSEQWFDVERYWRRSLEREGLDYFRTYECTNLKGEFQRKLVDAIGLLLEGVNQAGRAGPLAPTSGIDATARSLLVVGGSGLGNGPVLGSLGAQQNQELRP